MSAPIYPCQRTQGKWTKKGTPTVFDRVSKRKTSVKVQHTEIDWCTVHNSTRSVCSCIPSSDTRPLVAMKNPLKPENLSAAYQPLGAAIACRRKRTAFSEICGLLAAASWVQQSRAVCLASLSSLQNARAKRSSRMLSTDPFLTMIGVDTA